MTKRNRNNIAVCQIHRQAPDTLYTREFGAGIARINPDSYETVLKSLRKVLNSCAQEAFVAILPEISVPLDLLNSLRDEAARLELTIFAGLEHDVEWLSSTRKKDYQAGAFVAKNLLAIIRPDRTKEVTYGKKNIPAIMNYHSTVEKIETTTELEFQLVEVSTPSGGSINLWPVLCSDFLALSSKRILSRDELVNVVRTKNVDLIAVLSHTHRADPFHTAMEQLLVAGPIAVPTNIAFANLAYYGGSVCLAYSDRLSLRKGATQKARFWQTRALKRGLETYTVFPNWTSCVSKARQAR